MTDLSSWIDSPKSKLQTTLDHLQVFNILNIHNFSFGCLDSYFHLTEDLNSGKTILTGSENQILIMKKRRKVYVFDPNLSKSDLEMLKHLQRSNVIYSTKSIKLKKESTFNETVYHLPTVFNPDSYPTQKKRKNRIGYPFRWIANHNIDIRDIPIAIEDVEKLHNEWVANKMRDPTTFRMMFPQKRYQRCFDLFMVDNKNYAGKFFYNEDGRLLSVRIVALKGQWGYDLANFTRKWDGPSQISNYFSIYTLKWLYESKNIEYFNLGSPLNKGLSTFKNHYPHKLIKSYMYSKIKSEDIQYEVI